MTISGGIKFFERNTALFSAGTTATASSNSGSANNILTNRQLTYWQSDGSDDTTTETITITFNKSVTIDRIILNRVNFKQFTIQYDFMSGWSDFTNVIGLDGALVGGISETAFIDESAYYEVDSISTTRIQITATKTQTVDAEKIIYNLFTSVELGTLEQYPDISGLEFNRNSKKSKQLSGLHLIQKSFDIGSFSLSFKNHPSQADMDLINTLYDEENSFLVWFCGGRRGTTYFRYELKGYRLRDVLNMQTDGSMTPNYPNSIYVNAPNNSIKFLPSI